MSEMEKHPPKGEDSNLIVALRVRPMSEDEIIQGATPIAHKVDKNNSSMVVLMDPADDSDDILRANRSREKHYVFDCSFDGSTTQEEVYEHTSKFLIPQVIAGYNGTVFAYGATGAGKTYTMLGTDDDPGIMARALNDLFLKMEESSGEMTYEVSMSYLEIYNELIRDLLNPSVGFLDLREDSKGIQVAGLSEVHARSTREVMDMLMKGNKQRTQEPTAANKTSSRSHAVLQVSVKQRARMRNVMQQVRCGRLFLIDLAGSERAANTHNKGKRMVEGAHINRSLLALGNCINALSDKNGAKYVNYRDSKLTRLLKDALGGNCKTVMIAHISPASIHFEESRNTLVYADRAKQIKTKVRKNVMDVSYHITQYTNIIAELREEVKRLTTRLDHQQGKKNAAAIHAIQSEVMEAAMTEDQTEAMKLKEQLLTVFNEQMELRRSVMDLNNTSMEISLELARNQLFVQKWEREKALGSIRKRSFGVDPRLEDDDENKDKDTEKERELSGSPLVEEPEEVRLAREEMDTLHQERDKTERVKVNVMKELENSRDRAARIEEELPRKITSAEQQEILSLLCKVHELEIENMEMQSSCLLRNFELRRKDMLLSKHRQHHSLCHEIIMQQRHLIDTHDLAVPKELEELYTLYLQEVEERPATPQEAEDVLPSINNNRVAASVTTLNRRFLESDSLSDMDRLSQIDADSGSILGSRILVPVVSSAASNHVKKHLLKRSSQNLSKLEENELFSRSAKASQMPAAPVTSAAARQVHQRQPSILTLSSRSAATTPTPPVNKNEGEKPAASLRDSNDDHTVIVSNTRSIAALAARRRTEASQDIALQLMPKNGSYLTASRLANHDRKYSNNTNLTLQHLMDTDNVSITTMDSNRMGQGPPRYRPTKKSQAAANKSRKRNKSNETSYQQMTPEAFFKKLNKSTAAQRRPLDQSSMTSLAGRKSRLPRSLMSSRITNNKVAMSMNAENDGDAQEFNPPVTPPRTVQQTAPDRGKGLTVQKRVRGQENGKKRAAIHTSTTPQGGASNRTGRKPPPTIPNNYKLENFGITGHGLK